MKSKFFTQNVIPSDKFRENIKKLEQFSSEQLDDFAKWFNNLKVPTRGFENEREYSVEETQECWSKLDLSASELFSIAENVQYIFKSALSRDDDVDNIIDDFAELKLASPDNLDKLHNFFSKISQNGLERAKQRRRLLYARGEMPTLEQVGYDVELRLMPEMGFDPFKNEIENYRPKGVELIPIATIGLTLNDQENSTRIIMALNFSELEDLIVRLQACQKEMRLIEAFSQKNNISKFDI